MHGGIIVSETEPEMSNRYYWFKPSNRKWFELDGALSTWTEVLDETDLATLDHTHSSLGDIHFTDKVYAGAGDANQGMNKVVTIPDTCIMTFKKGLLVDFELIVPP
jgi:hypothetical protein